MAVQLAESPGDRDPAVVGRMQLELAAERRELFGNGPGGGGLCGDLIDRLDGLLARLLPAVEAERAE